MTARLHDQKNVAKSVRDFPNSRFATPGTLPEIHRVGRVRYSAAAVPQPPEILLREIFEIAGALISRPLAKLLLIFEKPHMKGSECLSLAYPVNAHTH